MALGLCDFLPGPGLAFANFPAPEAWEERVPTVRSFRILGPLAVEVDGEAAALGGQRRRSLLARLLLEPNRVVPAERLIDDLWGDSARATTANALQAGISALRSALEPDRDRRAADPVLIHTAGGYLLRVEEDELDAERFERLLAEGRRLLGVGAAEDAIGVLDSAITEFRGQVLPDLAGQPCAEPQIARLHEARDAAVEDRIDALIGAGRHVEAVPELERLTREAPLRERRWSQLMLALYRSGRQSEALRAYAQIRTILAEELGVEPSPLLRDLEQSMLLQRPELDVRLRAGAGPTSTMTLVFTDVAGSTELNERLGDAEYDRVRTGHLADVRRATEASGGQVVNSAGDGLLLRFASASAAVRAAIDVQRMAAGGPVSVKVGMDAGEPVETSDHDVIGSAVNRAARLTDAAAGGEILASATVRALVEPRGEVRFGVPRKVTLKGFDGLQEAHPVPWAEERRRGPRHPEPLVATDAYVGRTSELATLRAAWRQARPGAGRLCAVSGEPGAGKTRLASELSRDIAATGGLVLYGRCERDGSSFAPFTEAFGRYAEDLDDAELVALVGAEGHDLASVVPTLAARLPGPAATEPDPALRQLRLHQAVTTVLGRIDSIQPLLLVLDDLHWADAATVALVGHVARQPSARLVLLAYRDTDVDRRSPIAVALNDLHRVRAVESVRLQGLDVDEVAGCVAARAGQPCPEGVARLVHDRTGGNPLLVEELTYSLAAGGALDDEARAASATEVPPGVQSLIELRLTGLAEDESTVLHAAAVLGAELEWEALPATTGLGEAAVVDALDGLVEAGLLVEVRGTAGRYRFAHDLVRQSLYDRLGAARRLALHRQAADAVAALGIARPAEVARHRVAGATPATAAIAAEAAALAAADADHRFAHEEAARWYTNALNVLGDAGPIAPRAALTLSKAEALTMAGEFAAAREAFRTAARLAEECGDGEVLGRAALGFSGPSWGTGADWGTVDPEIIDLLDRADLVVDPVPSALRASLLACRAAHLAPSDPDEADRWSAAALAMAEALDDPDAERAALYGRRMAVCKPGTVADRFALDDGLVALTGEAHPRQHFEALLFRLGDLLEAGRIVEADALTEQMEAIGERLAWSFPRFNVLRYRAMRLAMAGRFDEALEVGQEALAIGQSTASEIATGSFGALMVGINLHRDQVTGVGDAMRMMATTMPGVTPYAVLAPLYWAEEGRLDEAAAEVAALAPRLDEAPMSANWITTVGLLAYAANAVGDAAAGAEVYRRLLPYAGVHVVAGIFVFTLGPVDRFLALAADVAGDIEAADRHFTDAAAFAAEMGCVIYHALGLVEHARALQRAGLDEQRARALLDEARAITTDVELPLVSRKLATIEEGWG